MRGLLWALVTFDGGLEVSLSESRSRLRLTDTTNSLLPGAFSWADVSSSGNGRKENVKTSSPCSKEKRLYKLRKLISVWLSMWSTSCVSFTLLTLSMDV